MQPIQIQNRTSHTPNRAVRLFGLALFLTGLVVFTATLFMGSYHLAREGLAALEGKIPAQRIQRLHVLAGQTWQSKFDLLDDIDRIMMQDATINAYELGVTRFLVTKAAAAGAVREQTWLFFLLSLGLASLGALVFILPGLRELPGIKHNDIWRRSLTARGLLGVILGGYLITFYIILYWFPEYIVNAILLVEPLSWWLRSRPADQWFLYGVLYTLAVAVMGIRMLIKYRHSRYHLIRTVSIIFFQTGFAFLLPSLMERLSLPAMDLKNAWPLNYTFFTDWNLDTLLSSGNFGLFLLVWGVILSLVVVPIMTYFFGKRWYCSWVCGCGGLAETLGDPFRHLSDKSLKAWRIEKIIIYSVLVFAVVMTVMQLSNYLSGGAIFASYTWRVNQAYSFFIGAIFAGVIGTGFYPLMGNRVWCRFGCPLAAYMGIIQRFKSRFRITTNGAQCISCGNCSTYCEMGIDVRWYAQRGQNIVRASCVGCGVCAAVCPRGVLSLENGPEENRFEMQV